MSADAPSQLRAVTFGDVDGSVWGAALGAGAGSGAAALTLGDGAGHASAITLTPDQWGVEGSTWRLAGDGFALEVAPTTQERESFPHEEPSPVTGIQELCRVTGSYRLDGDERRLDCVGTRSMIDGVDVASVGSLRSVTGWFADDEAMTLLSLRTARSTGQESDLVAATLFDPEGWVPVQDPRLSTTYDRAGVPTRVNLELWILDGENEFPRRAAGEAAETGAVATGPGLELRAVPLRCHSRGREGAGVYVLANL